MRLVVFAEDEDRARRACRAAFARVAQLDEIMSDWRVDSELMRLTARAGEEPTPVSDDLYRVLERAQDLARRSDGAFDVTAGPLVGLWRRARERRRLPSPESIAEARALVGWRGMTLDDRRRTVHLAKPGMRLDLGGIAKGYAGDRALEELRRHGIARALFEAGGYIVVGEPPPDALPAAAREAAATDRAAARELRGHDPRGWQITLFDSGETLRLSNCAVSTSGDTEQSLEASGERYSHIVDPRTGVGLTHRRIVTVIAPDGLTSDSLSTALSVLGEDEGRALARSYDGVSAFIRRAGARQPPDED